jgi:hypothetical protein
LSIPAGDDCGTDDNTGDSLECEGPALPTEIKVKKDGSPCDSEDPKDPDCNTFYESAKYKINRYDNYADDGTPMNTIDSTITSAHIGICK